MTSLPAAMLFDLDDTILAYDAASQRSWAAVCRHFAERVRVASAQELLERINQEADWYWSDGERHRRGRLNLRAARLGIITTVLHGLGVDDPELAAQMTALRDERQAAEIEPFPGALETVRALHQKGVRLGMITNGAAAVQGQKIERFNLRPLFDVIVIEGEFGCGKPDERVFHHALHALKAPAAEAWMVGDNLELDLAPAQALGLFAVWHDFRGHGLPRGAKIHPDRIIHRLTELLG